MSNPASSEEALEQTKARIRELEEKNLALKVALKNELLSRASIAAHLLALSQATKREGKRDFHIRQKGIEEQTDAARIQRLETALREIGQHPARYGIDASDFALDALSQAAKREGTEKVTHGRHCSCRACGAQDWSEPQLAPCGMHGSKCPPVYDPRGYAGEVVATKREGEE